MLRKEKTISRREDEIFSNVEINLTEGNERAKHSNRRYTGFTESAKCTGLNIAETQEEIERCGMDNELRTVFNNRSLAVEQTDKRTPEYYEYRTERYRYTHCHR